MAAAPPRDFVAPRELLALCTSQDIARRFITYNVLSHILAGGVWIDEHGVVQQASEKVIATVRDGPLGYRIGWYDAPVSTNRKWKVGYCCLVDNWVGKIVDIVGKDMAKVCKYDRVENAHFYGCPIVRRVNDRPPQPIRLWRCVQINVQHHCAEANCVRSATGTVRREQEVAAEYVDTIEHDDTDLYVLLCRSHPRRLAPCGHSGWRIGGGSSWQFILRYLSATVVAWIREFLGPPSLATTTTHLHPPALHPIYHYRRLPVPPTSISVSCLLSCPFMSTASRSAEKASRRGSTQGSSALNTPSKSDRIAALTEIVASQATRLNEITSKIDSVLSSVNAVRDHATLKKKARKIAKTIVLDPFAEGRAPSKSSKHCWRLTLAGVFSQRKAIRRFPNKCTMTAIEIFVIKYVRRTQPDNFWTDLLNYDHETYHGMQDMPAAAVADPAADLDGEGSDEEPQLGSTSAQGTEGVLGTRSPMPSVAGGAGRFGDEDLLGNDSQYANGGIDDLKTLDDPDATQLTDPDDDDRSPEVSPLERISQIHRFMVESGVTDAEMQVFYDAKRQKCSQA
ncbi:hypothetical protein DFS34DRAFT_696398 [Phlyctochytrium arcticum]|nr:hypothetical protein DFS34DRAFT_696398 [Phlyctochytrium arcticum]